MSNSNQRPSGASAYHLLSGREQNVLSLLVLGLSNKQIAKRLDIAEGTTKIHLHSIYKKLGVASRAELTVLAVSDPLLSLAKVNLAKNRIPGRRPFQ